MARTYAGVINVLVLIPMPRPVHLLKSDWSTQKIAGYRKLVGKMHFQQ